MDVLFGNPANCIGLPFYDIVNRVYSHCYLPKVKIMGLCALKLLISTAAFITHQGEGNLGEPRGIVFITRIYFGTANVTIQLAEWTKPVTSYFLNF